jgi:hypothetical protein
MDKKHASELATYFDAMVATAKSTLANGGTTVAIDAEKLIGLFELMGQANQAQLALMESAQASTDTLGKVTAALQQLEPKAAAYEVLRARMNNAKAEATRPKRWAQRSKNAYDAGFTDAIMVINGTLGEH